MRNNTSHPFFQFLSVMITITFCITMIFPSHAFAQNAINMPPVGQMLSPSSAFLPTTIKGITVFPDNPLKFDFIVDMGDEEYDSSSEQTDLKHASEKLVKYFLASLTVPEKDMWVNLSPDEPNRIIPEAFGQTEMGCDLLAQDYILKQLTASLMYPDNELGEKFWNRIYETAQEKYGITEIPVNTFNKVWIVPEKAVIYENAEINTAFVVESSLKVMLEEDYVKSVGASSAVRLDKNIINNNIHVNKRIDPSPVPTEIIRQIILPAISREVNHGHHFAQLRQIYHSMILATWFKRNLKESVLGQVYIDQNKTDGVQVQDKNVKDKIYAQYLKAFEKGVYNYIKEEYDPRTQNIVPRKYFSGGATLVHPKISSPKSIKSVKSVVNAMRSFLMKVVLNKYSNDAIELKEWGNIFPADALSSLDINPNEIQNNMRLKYLEKIQRIVNPDNTDIFGLYVHAGGDILNPLLTANPSILMMTDKLIFGKEIITDRASEQEQEIKNMLVRSLIRKGRNINEGFQSEATLLNAMKLIKTNMRELIILSLALIGVEEYEIKQIGDKKKDDWEIIFNWQHPSAHKPQKRTIYFLGNRETKDLIQLPHEINNLIKTRQGLDFFIEKAPNYYGDYLKDVTDFINYSEIEKINELERMLLKKGAVILGDDEQPGAKNMPSSIKTLIQDHSDFELLKQSINMKLLGLRVAWGNGKLEIARRIEGEPNILGNNESASAPLKENATYGGIDFNPDSLDLQTKGQKIDFSNPFEGLPCVDSDGDGVCEAPVRGQDINGFVPVIISITSISNLPLFLGLADDDEPYEDSEEESFDVSFVDRFNC